MSNYYNEESYEEQNNEEWYEEEDDEEDYISMECKLDDMMENIYVNVIVPYLDCICQQEILQELDEYTIGKFINFFKFNSPHYKYILNKIDNK
jgi:hypothetical protein